ncbi:MAG: MOSC N-terminal beta barrel domain-containing protein [Synechococcus sp.]|nr:MOSC N-terminal beta barrel domain-containing protein [Synechococcus sp.]
MARVAALWIYPIKSCGGISLNTVEVLTQGFKGDRQWMVVDLERKFLTQRQYPQLARVKPHITGDHLTLTFEDFVPLRLPGKITGPLKPVTIWRHQTQALDQGPEAAAWFSEVLQTPCHLVRQSPDHPRPLNPKYALWENQAVSFADGYPVLLTNTASVQDLAEKVGEPVPMNCFRPNLVVETETPFAEDQWQTLKIQDLTFVTAKPCDRCTIITTDQTTGDRHPTQEPLRTLDTFRRTDRGILLGINLMPTTAGNIAVGDQITINPTAI